MSIVKQLNGPSLEISGNLMQVPPVKDPSRGLNVPPRRSIQITEPRVRRPIVKSAKSTSSMALVQTPKPRVETSANVDNTNELNKLKEYIKVLEEEIVQLKKKLGDTESKVKTHEKSLKDYENKNESLIKANESLKLKDAQNLNKISDLDKLIASLRDENDSLMRQLQINANLNLTLAKTNDDIQRLRDEHDNQMKRLKDEHARELKIRDDKLENLKKQIAGAFKDNSWERQLQIEELTKELKRTQEEYEMIKFKLKGFKNKNGDSCSNCDEMQKKLSEKNKIINEKEESLSDLVNLMDKFKSQLNIQDDLLRFTANKITADLTLKSQNKTTPLLNGSSYQQSFKSKK